MIGIETAAPWGAQPPVVPEPGAQAFVWGAWSFLTLTATWFVAHYGVNIPLWDDYHIVLTLIGDRPVSLDWLWEQCNEHRIGLPKLILLYADRLAGNDIRAGMFLSVATLSALAAALIVLSARLRSGPRPSDAIFPILLLHPGHATNLLWSFQFTSILPTALGTAFLVPILGRRSWPGPWTAVLAGSVMGLLPLCGATGLVFVPALALWLLGAAVAEVRSGHTGGWRRAALISAATLPGLCLTVLYFRGFRKTLHPAAPDGLLAGFRAGIQFLSGGVGMPAAWAWPWSGMALVGLVALALVILGRAWIWRAEERPRIFGLVAFLMAMTALATAVGWGRGWAGEQAGFQTRYVTMATPIWCWLALTYRLYAPPAVSRLVPNALFVLSCVLFWPNAQTGLEHGRESLAQARAFTRDLVAGMPPYQLVRRHALYLYPSQDEAARILPLLRRAGYGPFRFLHDNPPFHEIHLPLKPTALSLARWEGNTVHVTGVDPQVTFTLPSPRHVAGIRIKYAHANRQGAPARFQLTWKHPGQHDYTATQRHAYWFQPTGEGNVTTVWIDDLVDQFRIQPDNQPCEFRIDDLVLLVP